MRDGERLLCATCAAGAPTRAAEAARHRSAGHRLGRALRERRGSLVAGGMVLATLGAAVGLASVGRGGGTAISQALADDPAFQQRVAAERYCAAGGAGWSGDVPTISPAAESRPGGIARAPGTGASVAAVLAALPDTLLRDDRLASTAGSADPHDLMNVVRLGTGPVVGWRSRTTLFPQQLGYELRGQVSLDRVAFRHAPSSPPDTRARDVSLLVSTAGPDRSFYQLGRWNLAQHTDPQEFLFWETPATHVRVCLHGNYGASDAVTLGAMLLGIKGGTGPLMAP